MTYTITENPKKYSRQYNVYKITNTIDNKIYIGSTTTPLWHRMSQHRADARKGKKSPLYNLMREYGIDNFHIESIAVVNENELRTVEEMEITNVSVENRLNFKKSCKKDISKKYDYNEIVNIYKKVGSYNATANIIGCSRVTVKKAVKKLLLDL